MCARAARHRQGETPRARVENAHWNESVCVERAAVDSPRRARCPWQQISSPWKEASAPDGRKYYYNAETGETRWDTPVELKKERRKCDNCDKKARVKVTGVDG